MKAVTHEQATPDLAWLEGIRVVDVDTHLTEPADLWTSRAPAKYVDLVPRVKRFGDRDLSGVLGWRPGRDDMPVWVVGEDTVLGFAGGASVVNADNQKVRGTAFINWALTDVSPAASFVEPRLKTMDADGIWAQVVYPNAVGFGGQAFASIKDPELRALTLRIWNDAMAEMYAESNGRLCGMGMIPWWDMDLAVSEIERVAAIGLKGVNTNSDPHDQGLPDLADSTYQRMWEACAHHDLPVNFHIGASVSAASYNGTSPWPSLDGHTKMAIGSAMLYIGNARVLANLILSGVLERNPRLKVVSVESGIGWIPFILGALDYQAEENNVDHLSMRPSEYFHRQMYSCFWFEGGDVLLHSIEQLGPDKCMFETDFPHPTCLFPDPLRGVATSLQRAPMEVRRKVLSETAVKVYNLDLPA